MPDTPAPFSFPTPDPQDGAAEILEAGSGQGPLRPERERDPRARRRLLLAGVGVLGVGAVTAAAFGAWWYTSTGPQPAEALPSTVLGYAAIDLDPAGHQKLAALDVLKKMPAVEDGLDLGGNPVSVDVTGGLLESLLEEVGCDGVSAGDVTSWLGDRAAVAAVPGEAEEMPDPVVVLQVGDGEAAREGLTELAACGDLGDLDLGIDVEGEWAVVAETQEIVDRVVADRDRATLADDADFRSWTAAAGDPGVVQLYAAPSAGDWMAELYSDELMGGAFTMAAQQEACPFPVVGDEEAVVGGRDFQRAIRAWERCVERFEADPATLEESPAIEQARERLRAFEGLATTVRFDAGGVEVETAGDSSLAMGAPTSAMLAGTGAGDALAALPADTAVGVTTTFADGWFDALLDNEGRLYAALGLDPTYLFDELERSTDLRLPEDARVLDGRTLSFAMSDDFDPDADFRDLELGLRLDGDSAPVADLVDRIRSTMDTHGADGGALEDRVGDGVLAVGPSGAWNESLLEDGDLGETAVFEDVLPDIADASVAGFVDLRAVLDWVEDEDLSDDERELIRNLRAFTYGGGASWQEDGVEHALLRVTTED